MIFNFFGKILLNKICYEKINIWIALIVNNVFSCGQVALVAESGGSQSDSQTKSEIWRLEGIEATAMHKNDTATLNKIWPRTFEVNPPLQVTVGKNILPNYSYFTRQDENVWQLEDDVVLTAGKK